MQIKQSKTNPFRKGIGFHVGRIILFKPVPRGCYAGLLCKKGNSTRTSVFTLRIEELMALMMTPIEVVPNVANVM